MTEVIPHFEPPRPRQFVAVEFHPADRRSYTYHNDGEPVAIGDRVVVNTKKGTATVTVSGLPAAAPKGRGNQGHSGQGAADRHGQAGASPRAREPRPAARHGVHRPAARARAQAEGRTRAAVAVRAGPAPGAASVSRTDRLYVCACRHCGRAWDHEGCSATSIRARAGKSNAMGFIVAAAAQHEAACARLTPAERRAANARAEARWKANPPRSRIWNDPSHPGLQDHG
jgi:hypothetical protein